MKIMWRTLIILVAAAVVTAATMGAMQLPAVQSVMESQGGAHHGPPAGMTSDEFAGEFSGDEAAAGTAAGAASRPMRSERGEQSGGNLAGLFEVVKNFVVVVVFSLAIGAAGWAVKRIRPRRHLPAAA